MRHLALVLSLLVPAQDASSSKALVLRGARVYTGTGPAVEGALIIVEKGLISAVGKDLPIPAGADVIDAAGKVVIPGLIDAASRLFIPVGGERSAGSAEQRALDGLDFFQPEADEAVEQGVTTVYVGPVSTGVVNGLGAVVHLDSARTVLIKDAALKVTLGSSGGESSSPLDRSQSLAQLRQAFEGARQYQEDGEKYRRDQTAYEQAQKEKKTTDLKPPTRPKTDPKQEVLARCLDQKAPLTLRIEVHAADGIRHVLGLVDEFKLKAVLECATEGAEAAPAIAGAKVPAVVGPVFRTGPFSVDYLRHSPRTASVLERAGVLVAVGSFADERAGASGPGASRFLLESASAASPGLPPERALALVTSQAAKILGLEKTIGSIEKGKAADLVLLSGEPFEPGTRVERTWVDGATVYARGRR